MCSRSLLLLALSAVFVLCPAAFAQIPGLTPAAASPTTPQPVDAPDPLGRDNPRGCILGFIRAAQEERFSLAVQYFQSTSGRRRHTSEDEQELATQLLAILNQRFAGPLDFMSRDPLGRLDDGLPPNQEKVGGTLGTTEQFPIYLVRIEDEQGRKLWYIARASLDQVPEMYESLVFPELEKQVPKTLVTHRFLSMPLWQWLAILLFIPVALLLARLLTIAFGFFLRYWRKLHGIAPLPKEAILRLGPVTYLLATLIHYWFVGYIGTSLLYRLYYRRIIWIFLLVSLYWLLTRITRAISSQIGKGLASRGMFAERSIVSLVRRLTEAIIFLFVTLIVLHTLGLNVSTALAGVGIGGIALGLGAQKTLENMFGGISILLDKVIQIGDVCKINGQVGVVEDIGLRSTRLRTPERTQLSIPNGILSTATVENLRFRDKFLCQQVIRLRYDLAPDHVRYVLEELRKILRENPKVEETSARVRFLRFAEYALELEVFCYILERDFVVFLSEQEALLLQITDALEKSGVVVALPTQTTFVTKDSWIDPEKEKAVKAAIEKARDPGVPGPRERPPTS
jgi:MscS family membrane protein